MQTLERNAVTMEPGKRNSVSWIDDGEKYAVIALDAKLDDPVPLQEMTPHHWAFSDERFDIPPHWHEWLGTIRTREVEDSNLFLLSKMRSQAPDIIDAETAELKRHAGHFYVGLLLASPFAPAHRPVMLVGYRLDSEINVRSQDDFETAIPSIVRHYPPVRLAELQLAAKIATQIATIETTPLTGGHWRLFRILQLYLEARTIQDNMDRLQLPLHRGIDRAFRRQHWEAIQEPDRAVHRPSPSRPDGRNLRRAQRRGTPAREQAPGGFRPECAARTGEKTGDDGIHRAQRVSADRS
jgi:hypothetical protein